MASLTRVSSEHNTTLRLDFAQETRDINRDFRLQVGTSRPLSPLEERASEREERSERRVYARKERSGEIRCVERL